MIVRLKPKSIIENSYSEEQLSDLSIMESIYIIRKMKACFQSIEDDGLEVSEPNSNEQVYSEQFKVWFSKHEYVEVKYD